jgi:Holliday junction resolvase RusA-like endonuclease
VTAYYFLADNMKDLDNLLKFTLDLLVGPVMADNNRFVSEAVPSRPRNPWMVTAALMSRSNM